MVAYAIGVTCVFLLSVAFGAHWAHSSRKVLVGIAKENNGIRRQLANIISMMQRAGFKRGRPNADWSDDTLKTQVKGAGADGRFQWKK